MEDGLTLDLNRLIRQRHISPGAWSCGPLNWKMVDSGEHTASISYEADLSDPENAWMRLHYKRDGAPEDYKSGCRQRDQNTAVGAGGFFALQGRAERQSYIWQPVEIGSCVDKPMHGLSQPE